jgi:hypothetical protein
MIGLKYSFQNRAIKDFLRISLGFAWGISLSELSLQPLWSDKLIIMIFMITFFVLFRRFRRLQTSRRPLILCDNCKELNINDCIGYKNQFEAERLYSRELSDFLQQKLNWDDIQRKLRGYYIS